MQTLDAALERMMAQGVISPESALEKCTDKEALMKLIARSRPDLAEPSV
jgi:hypothetical protein